MFFTGAARFQVTAIAFPYPSVLAWLPVVICGKPDQETESTERSSLFRSVHKHLHQRGATRTGSEITESWNVLGGKGPWALLAVLSQKQRNSEATGCPSCPAGCEPGSEIPVQSVLGFFVISQDHNPTAGMVTASVPMSFTEDPELQGAHDHLHVLLFLCAGESLGG